MICSSCGSVVKDGTGVCPVCGEEILRKQARSQSRTKRLFALDEVTEREAAVGTQKLAIEPIGALIKLRLGSIIVELLSVAAAIYILLTVGRLFADEFITYDELEEYGEAFSWMTRGLSIVSILITCAVIAQIFKLNEIERTFRNAKLCGIMFATLGALNLLVDNTIVSLGVIVLGVLFCKLYSEAMRELCLPNCRAASESWATYWKVYLIASIAALLIGVIYVVKAYGDQAYVENLLYWDEAAESFDFQNYLTTAYILVGLFALFELVGLVFELKALRGMKEAFEAQQ